MASSEAMTSSTHSFAYSYGLVKKCYLKICETSKFHNLLIFQPIFIRFSLFCSENFTLSSEIKLDQLRTSPLRAVAVVAARSCHDGCMNQVYFLPRVHIWVPFAGDSLRGLIFFTTYRPHYHRMPPCFPQFRGTITVEWFLLCEPAVR